MSGGYDSEMPHSFDFGAWIGSMHAYRRFLVVRDLRGRLLGVVVSRTVAVRRSWPFVVRLQS